MMIIVLFLLAAVTTSCRAQGATDQVKGQLPGVNFNYNFKQYSGYLNANDAKTWKLHYVLMEAQTNPSTAPLLLWLNGGPGCSSVGGAFEELGPFYPNRDGQSLYENVFAWNKVANVLYLESPIGVGYSYDTSNPSNVKADDLMVAQENYLALKDFFENVQPSYINRTFFISGESYAGIYLPTLADKLVAGINNGDFKNANFQGIAIGNGYMNVKYLTNSLVLWMNYHGVVALDQWEIMKQSCCQNGDVDKCNFYGSLKTSDNLNFDSDGTTCGNLTYLLLTDQTPPWPENMDPYNFYQDCYEQPTRKSASLNFAKFLPKASKAANTPGTAQNLYYDSTDNQYGNPCWSDVATTTYLNRKDVQSLLNIPSDWQTRVGAWHDCNGPIYGNYTVTVTDTSDFFRRIINNVKTPNFRILIYNGDVDTICNYLGDAWHIRDIAGSLGMQSQTRAPWRYRNQIAGYVQRYTGKVPIDVLTVKGAGHFVPNDRPGPALQMIANFIRNVPNYSTATGIDVTPKGPNQQGTSSSPNSAMTVTNGSLVLVTVLAALCKLLF